MMSVPSQIKAFIWDGTDIISSSLQPLAATTRIP